MGATPTYTTEQKTHAVELYSTIGPRAAAREIGCHAHTVIAWARAAGVEPPASEAKTRNATEKNRLTWVQRRGELLDKVGAAADKLLDKALEADDAKDTRDLVWSAAVLIDKGQLLSGGATTRAGIEDPAERAARVAQIADEVAAARDRKQQQAG